MEELNRKSCRALLVNPENEVLLIEIANPSSQWRGWIAPGGGMEPGESEDQALRRELSEELNLETDLPALKVWTRFHEFVWGGKLIRQHEDYFLLRTPHFEPRPRPDRAAAELAEMESFRWWSVKSLNASHDKFGPNRFPQLFQSLLESGPPAEPLDVGI